ncbi:hypothetical protein [Anabaena sp. CCY 9910]|uniref:hypothetical protein n=1 Tax=Anabaena sp. CCY 9910 TaxID=3103870 RepID=UPI0039E13607
MSNNDSSDAQVKNNFWFQLFKYLTVLGSAIGVLSTLIDQLLALNRVFNKLYLVWPSLFIIFGISICLAYKGGHVLPGIDQYPRKLTMIISCVLIGVGVMGLFWGVSNENSVKITPENPQQDFSGTLIAPGKGFQNYKITYIDVTDFTKGGKLTIDILLMDGISWGSFDLFPEKGRIPTQGSPNSLVGAYNVKPNSSTHLVHYFDKGVVFRFGATGNWGSPKDSTNSFKASVYVEP